MGFVVRGVFLVEFVASFFRLGWLYLISPIRLCNNYALDDQQRLGGYMLAIGGGLLVWLAWKLLWGRFESFSSTYLRSAPMPQPRPLGPRRPRPAGQRAPGRSSMSGVLASRSSGAR
jgi:hypothetical protein